jgi:ketosteroid isomerase-like protein
VGEYADRLHLTFAAFNEHGPSMYEDPAVQQLIVEWVDPDIECVSAGGVQGGTYRGYEGLIEMVTGFSAAFDGLTTEVEEVLEETADALVVSVRYRGAGATSGAPVDERYVWAQRFVDGRTVAFAIDRDRDRAMRIAGLRR